MDIIDRLKGLRRNLPIGIQSFERLRRDGYLYVDKTAFVYELASTGNPYFLRRHALSYAHTANREVKK